MLFHTQVREFRTLNELVVNFCNSKTVMNSYASLHLESKFEPNLVITGNDFLESQSTQVALPFGTFLLRQLGSVGPSTICTFLVCHSGSVVRGGLLIIWLVFNPQFNRFGKK